MKNILLIFVCFLLLFTQVFAQKPADINATKATVDLSKKLVSTTEKGIMIGHQDDLVYGHSWNVDGVSDVKQTAGDFPAVYGWELGDLELGRPASLDGVDFANIKNKIKWVNAQGGINVISWHCNNPLTGKNAWDVSSKLVVKSVLPGGEKNELFVKMLDRLADFFLSLKDEKGELIPVVFRPWHEHTGSWFWWGKNLCSKDEYVALWKYTVTQLQAKGVHNILYAYSAAGGFNNSSEYMDRFPGVGIVDLLGFDEYQGGISGKDNYMKSIAKGMSILLPIAKVNNKIAILSETGCESLPDPKWWTETLWPAIKDYPIAYVLFWRNAHDKPTHYYMPFPGEASAANFRDFEKIDRTLFLRDVR
ncbi:MAG: glycosyl hydrolase [Bacteroidia bacterium]|nr:glycosyl hydrolase [Bacteroidia bacterium]